jgi:cobalt-zinc-cadmium efflux system outer membrane protein
LESDFRIAISQMIASQERVRLFSEASGEIEHLTRLLRQREAEGEGSRYDVLRAQRELMELHPELGSVRSALASAGAQVEGFLPEGSVVQRVKGQLLVENGIPKLDDLLRRAFTSRHDYQALQTNLSRYRSEEQAARSLRIPEPTVTAGLKRADVTSGTPPNPFAEVTKSGLVFGVTVPLPLFNRGQYDVARFQAEQSRLTARKAALQREIRTEVQGALQVLTLRKNALEGYQESLRATGSELTQITQIAYQEGEIGILELLDAIRISRTSDLRLLNIKQAVTEAWIELDRVVGAEVRP